MSLTCAPIRHPAARIGAWSRRRLALTLCSLGLSLNSSPLLAQPESDLGTRGDVTAPALVLLMPEAIAVVPREGSQSATLVVDGKLQPLVDDLLERSTVFRRQWQRLSRFPRLTLRLELVHAYHLVDVHAATDVSVRPDGSWLAVIAMPGGTRLPELIAHEVEHVLERLDGVKVAASHALGDDSIRRASHTFETARAVLVGQMVAREFRPR